MRVLVTVSSRHGGTGEIGRTVAQVLRDAGHEVTETDPDEVQGLEGVDAVVLGSSVYVGRLAAALRELVDRQAGRLAALPVWLFWSGPVGDVPGGGVRVGWQRLPGSSPSTMELWVEDEGPGLANTGNLFVPFFTTKPGGSGIGLVLSRQIAEAHGGSLTLENRDDRTGCRASLRVPIHAVLPPRVEALAQASSN